MTATPRLGAPQLVDGQATPEATVNEQIRYVEQGAGMFVVKDKDLATPPGSPADGDRYIVAGSPMGAWTGWAGRIAFYMSTQWVSITVPEGFFAWVEDENLLYYASAANTWSAYTTGGYTPGGTDVALADGGTGASLTDPNADRILFWDDSAGAVTWLTPGTNLTITTTTIDAAGATESTNSELWTGASATTFVTPNRLFGASAAVAVASGTTITLDGNTGFNFSTTLAHNATLANPSNFKVGQSGAYVITQDGTGSRTLAYGSQWKFPGGAPVLSTSVGAIDVLSYYVSASGVILCNLSKAYS